MISLKFEGGAELQQALGQLSDRVSKKVQLEALTFAADLPRRRMQELVHVEPGKPDIKDHMVITPVRGEVAVSVGPAKASFYGSFLEFGTRHAEAFPFARPAFDQTWQKSLELISQDLWAAMAARRIGRSSTVETGVTGGPGGSLL